MSGPHGTPEESTDSHALADKLLVAARAHGGGAAAAHWAARLAASAPSEEARRRIATAAGLATATALDELWQAGWLPTDVWEVTRRQADDTAAELAVDVIAADTARRPAAALSHRWAAQVTALDAQVWWPQDTPHLTAWTRRSDLGWERALATLLLLLHTWQRLPRLPVITSLPGARATPRGTASAVDPKVLARVRGLLAKAESTSFPEEAEALSAKAQELMHRHAFERALLDATTPHEQTADSTRLWLDAPYLQAKSQLVAAIGEANRCRSVFYPRLGFVGLVGEELDLQITELLATSLLVQATRAMVAEGGRTRAGVSRTRAFRRSFLLAFAVRIGERLKEASAAALDPVADARLLPVLAARSRAVDATFEALFTHTVRAKVSVSDSAGWNAGYAAADRADLTLERGTLSA